MKKITSIALVIIMMLMMFPFAVIGQEESSISQYLDKMLAEMVNQKEVKGAIISVVAQDRVELCKGYGMADDAEGIAANEDNTAFRIGSVSKTFVAVAALKLVQEGKLDLNAPISDYLQVDFPKFKYDITMHDLLTHTAGFEDIISGIAVDDINQAETLAVSIRKYMPAQVFVPGEVISYSNYGIALAAYVIECITGEEFYKYADHNIFVPLGMTSTSFALDHHGVKVSKAYAANGRETTEPLINLYPEGSAVSTAVDMARYMQWLMDDNTKVLNKEYKQQLFQQHYTMADEFEGIGYTWNRKGRNGILYYEKKGETDNFLSRIVIYPQQKTGVFISFNTKVDEEKIEVMMNGINNLLLGTDKQISVYVGEQTKNISGYYVANRSSFNTPEKILNILIPNRILKITGNPSDGFKLNGEKLLPVGNNYYSSPIGYLKFIEKNGSLFMATDSAISYVQTNWYESKAPQMIITGLFAATLFLMAVISMISLLRRRGPKMNRFLAVVFMTEFAAFIGMCVLLLVGISSYQILKMALFIQVCGIIILGLSVCAVLYLTYLNINKRLSVNRILVITGVISSLLFCLWMGQVNLL